MAKCKSCEAPIEWATTEAGKAMPLDAQPTPDGTWCLVNGKTWKATDEDRKLHRPLHTPHWATCADAPKFRRRK